MPDPDSSTMNSIRDGKASYLGFPEHDALSQACVFINAAFGETCYLVGSSLETREFRDIDVRLILDDEDFDGLFDDDRRVHTAFWSLINVALSEYLRTRTGLPIDFQVQRRSAVTEEDWQRRREPLGAFIASTKPPWGRRLAPDPGREIKEGGKPPRPSSSAYRPTQMGS